MIAQSLADIAISGSTLAALLQTFVAIATRTCTCDLRMAVRTKRPMELEYSP